MQHDAWFFIGVFAFIFLIWIITGGPVHPLAFTGPKLAAPQELGGGTYLSLPRAPFGVGGANVSLPGSSSGGGAVSGSQASVPSLYGGTAFGEVSPYRGVISMNHYISNAGTSNVQNEYIELSVSSGASVPVDLTGWMLVSGLSGSSAAIPRGTEVPISGTVNAIQDIVLKPGDRAWVISGRSPIGASFRENKCIGYFSNFQSFTPSLPQNCPVPIDELSSSVGPTYIRDSACVDYVQPLSRCKAVLTPPTNISGACQSFVVKYLNYNGCLDAHKGDADFAGTAWHIYLGRTTPLWQQRHEIVKLLDPSGKTVDAFSY